MKSIDEERKLLESIVNLIAKHFGEDTEVVLHDYTGGDSKHTITHIVNGNITGRKVGDYADKHGLLAVPGENVDGNCYNEIIYTEAGRILKGSTFNIRDDDGSIIGGICINQDITEMVRISNFLQEKTGYKGTKDQQADISDALNAIIQEAFLEAGKHPNAMAKEDKIAFIKYLDDRGAFLISKSGPRICELLDISKYTLYHYLDIARGESKDN